MSKKTNRVIIFFVISSLVVTGSSLLYFLGTLFGKTINLLVHRKYQFPTIDVSSSNNTKSPANYFLKVNIALDNDNYSGYSIIQQPELRKILVDKYGIKINYQRHDRKKEINLLNDGEVDIWATTLDRYLEEKPNGKIIGLIDRSIGADALIIHKEKYANLQSRGSFNSLLRSKNGQNKPHIVYVDDSSSEYLALAFNKHIKEFNLKKFRPRETNEETETWQLLKNYRSTVAVGVVSEPHITLAEKHGYEVFLSSKNLDKIIVNVIVASDHTLRVNPEKIVQFLEAYYASIDKNVLEPVKIQEYIANENKISLEEAEKILTKIDFFTAVESKNWIEDGRLEESLNSIASILLSTGKIKENPENYQAFFSSDYLKAASTNTVQLINELKRQNPQLAGRLAGIGETIVVKKEQNE